jgi:hypothetical protein
MIGLKPTASMAYRWGMSVLTTNRFTVEDYHRMGETGVLNLPERRLEVYREPHFAGYSSVTVLRTGDQACPLTFPDAVLEVEDLLRQGD